MHARPLTWWLYMHHKPVIIWINDVYYYIYRHTHACTLILTSQSSSGNWDRTGMRLWARSGLSLEVRRERRRRRSREEKEDITHCTATATTTTLLHQLQLILSYTHTERSIPFTHRASQRVEETATHHKARPALLYSYYSSSCPWRAAQECPYP